MASRKFETLKGSGQRGRQTDEPADPPIIPVSIPIGGVMLQGDLHVPSALIEAMRASACIVLEMDFNTRVSSLLHDYAHLIAAPEALRTRLGYLTMLHGRQRIAHWNGLIENARWGDLVESLLALHYDAAYRHSTHENFGKIGQAQRVALSSADVESFNAAAVSLIENQTG